MCGGGYYYHDNSKSRSSIFTKRGLTVDKGSDRLQLIKFGPSCAMGTALQLGEFFFGFALLRPARRVSDSECFVDSACVWQAYFA